MIFCLFFLVYILFFVFIVLWFFLSFVVSFHLPFLFVYLFVVYVCIICLFTVYLFIVSLFVIYCLLLCLLFQCISHPSFSPSQTITISNFLKQSLKLHSSKRIASFFYFISSSASTFTNRTSANDNTLTFNILSQTQSKHRIFVFNDCNSSS